MANDPKCFICGSNEESTLHILGDCPAAKIVWRKLDGPAHSQQFFQGNMKAGLDHLQWRTRKDNGAKVHKFINWHPPQSNWYVLICDGTVRGSHSPAGCGVVIRDHLGKFVSDFIANSQVRQRLWQQRAWPGLWYANKAIEVQSDSLTCVQMLNNNATPHGDYALDLKYCRFKVQKSDWKVKIIHVYRGGNCVANWLANQGITQDIRLQFLHFTPIQLIYILEEDVRWGCWLFHA